MRDYLWAIDQRNIEILKNFQNLGVPGVFPQPRPTLAAKSIAIIPIEGFLMKNRSVFGSTPLKDVQNWLRAALDNRAVKAIVLKIDSPGGAVDGTQDLARFVFESRPRKPIVAFCDGLMASGAYWIGAAAQKIVASSETVQFGNLGVVATHIDVSRLEQRRGLRVTEIVSAAFKRILSSHRPLSESGRAIMQSAVDTIHREMVGDIARFRGAPIQIVTRAANGRIFFARQALAAGLIDDIMPFEQFLSTLQTQPLNPWKEQSKMTNLSFSQQAKPKPDKPLKEAASRPKIRIEHKQHYHDWVRESPTMKRLCENDFSFYRSLPKRDLEGLRKQASTIDERTKADQEAAKDWDAKRREAEALLRQNPRNHRARQALKALNHF